MSILAVHADHRVLALATGEPRALLDAIERMLGGVAEHREDRDVAQHGDAVVAPEAGRDHSPVEPKDHRQFRPVKADPVREARKRGDLGTVDHGLENGGTLRIWQAPHVA